MILLKSAFEELNESAIEDSSDEENRPQIIRRDGVIVQRGGEDDFDL